LKQKLQDIQGEALALGNLGAAYYALGDNTNALDYQQQSLAICREIEALQIEATILCNMGSTLTELKRYSEARDALQTALKICRDLGDLSTIDEVLLRLTDLPHHY
jgi:tetratricopeptide (TPR) repeat protein